MHFLVRKRHSVMLLFSRSQCHTANGSSRLGSKTLREMDQTGDGFISLLDVQNVRDSNVDWYTGEQAIAKRAANPALFEDFRSLFCCFGFDYAQPFSLNAACACAICINPNPNPKKASFCKSKPQNRTTMIV